MTTTIIKFVAELCEEWTNTREPVADGVTFYVRYLGSSLVEDPKSAHSTAAGVKRVIHCAKAGARRPERVSFRVAMEGVRIDSTTTGETIMDTSIYKYVFLLKVFNFLFLVRLTFFIVLLPC